MDAESIILALLYMHTCVYMGGCVRMAIVVMPDKLFVLSYKCTLN